MPSKTQKVYYQNLLWGTSYTPQILFPDNGEVAMIPCSNGYYFRQVSTVSSSSWVLFQQGSNNVYDNPSCSSGNNYAASFGGGYLAIDTGSGGCNGNDNPNFGIIFIHSPIEFNHQKVNE